MCNCKREKGQTSPNRTKFVAVPRGFQVVFWIYTVDIDGNAH